MRPVINKAVENLPAASEVILAEARALPPKAAAHDRLLRQIELFHTLEWQKPQRPQPVGDKLKIAALNAERLKNPIAVQRLLARTGAQAALLSEVDVGMARSGNAHTVRELIGGSGAGYVFGVEFVELDLGDAREIARHAGQCNRRGLHGNAIVSGLALEAPHLIPLEESGLWFPGRKGAQRRIGGRIAVAARVASASRPFWLVSVHLESKTDPRDRQAQTQRLLRALDAFAPHEACVIGGDFNTKALPRSESDRQRLLAEPERDEPLFGDLRRAGFTWAQANRADATQQDGPSKQPPRPFGKLDWIVVRGVSARDPQVIAAVDDDGRPLSDHALLTVEISI